MRFIPSTPLLQIIVLLCTLVILLNFTSHLTLADFQETYIRSPITGTHIPVSLLSERIPISRRHPSGLVVHVFEWSPEENLVRSAFKKIDLASHTKSRTVKLSPQTKITLNGFPYSADNKDEIGSAEAIITSSNDGSIDAVFHAGDLIHVWAENGLRLIPLHHPDNLRTLFIAENYGADENDDYEQRVIDEADDNSVQEMMVDSITKSFTLMNAKLEPKTSSEAAPYPESSKEPPFTETSVMETAEPLGACAEGVLHYLEIAIAYDNSLCRFYNHMPGRTFAMIAVLFEVASRPYVQDTCIRLSLSHLEAHCQDPQDPYIPLREQVSIFLMLSFANVWIQPPRDTIPRDVVYFISGFNDGTSALGFAINGERGGICNPSFSVGWCEGIIPAVFAHEIGHTLGVSHSETGLMQAFYEPRIVIPRFSKESISSMTTFIDRNPLVSCLSTTPPVAPLLPITTAVPSPTILPEYGTCDVSRRKFNVLSCTRPRVIGHIFPPLNLSMVGALRVISWQDFGAFHVKVEVIRTKTVEIREFRGVQHLNGTFVSRTLGLAFRPDGRDQIVTTVARLDRDSVRIRWPRPKLSCCDNSLYIFLNIRWCLKKSKGPGSICATMFKRLSRFIPCRSPCFGKKGRLLKMSEKRRCPSCDVWKS